MIHLTQIALQYCSLYSLITIVDDSQNDLDSKLLTRE